MDAERDGSVHISVMPREILAALAPKPGGVFADGTLGGGGHTRLLADAVGPTGKVIAVDRDPAAIARAEIHLKGMPVLLAQANFDELPQVLPEAGVEQIDGVVLDLGLSSDQLADRERGFSFDSEGELDMRFDPTAGEPAWRLLGRLRENEIADLIYQFGEERCSRRIAREFVSARKQGPIKSVREFADLVRRCVPRGVDRIDPATRTFQALRIAVNDELGSLRRALADLPAILKPGGTIAILSFHSLEDRIVKEAFRSDERLEIVTKKPLIATEEETSQNPRSRSAKLRVARRR
jgi:16S rRNA (cytosine1402-N4)-methyltransferase